SLLCFHRYVRWGQFAKSAAANLGTYGRGAKNLPRSRSRKTSTDPAADCCIGERIKTLAGSRCRPSPRHNGDQLHDGSFHRTAQLGVALSTAWVELSHEIASSSAFPTTPADLGIKDRISCEHSPQEFLPTC